MWTLEEDWVEQCIPENGRVLAVLLLFPVNDEEREEVKGKCLFVPIDFPGLFHHVYFVLFPFLIPESWFDFNYPI